MNSVMDIIGLAWRGDSVERLSSQLNESQSATRKGLEGAVPLSMAGLASLFSTENKASELLEAFQGGTVPHVDAGELGSVVSDRAATDKLAQAGKGLLGRIFGSKLDTVLETFSGQSGVSRSSATTLLGLAAPLVLGAIKKESQSRHLDARGLSQFLNIEGRKASGLLPGNLSSLLSRSDAEARPGKVSYMDRAVETHSYNTPSFTEPPVALGDAPTRNESHKVTSAVPSFAPAAGSAGRKKNGWMWLGLALGGLLLFGLFRRGESDRIAPREANRPAPAAETPGDTDRQRRGAEIAPAPLDNESQRTGSATIDNADKQVTGQEAAERALPPTEAAPVIEEPSEPQAQPAQAVRPERDEDGVGGRQQATAAESFTVQFATNSDRPRSRDELDRAVRALQEDGNAKATLKGYADPRGNEDANQALSEARAASVKKYLVKKGVDPSRVETAAHGVASPLATNAQSRRVEIVIEP